VLMNFNFAVPVLLKTEEIELDTMNIRVGKIDWVLNTLNSQAEIVCECWQNSVFEDKKPNEYCLLVMANLNMLFLQTWLQIKLILSKNITIGVKSRNLSFPRTLEILLTKLLVLTKKNSFYILFLNICMWSTVGTILTCI
jgi:hypothetical protein